MSKIPVVLSSELLEGRTLARKAEGQALLLTRVGGCVYAVENRCPHMGLPLTRGKLDGKVVRCPWHGSRFDLSTGESLGWADSFAGVALPRWSHGLLAAGRKARALQAFPCAEEDERVWLELPDAGQHKAPNVR
ncbi:Rieske (2Fe-2S) protein [Sinimarinibacterium flocculans]|uniref:Rieske (2Fe-2S) protein n=1 Tax=Sinimarinibacterium flocculans TaxID=985250 RepID=UPI00351906A4